MLHTRRRTDPWKSLSNRHRVPLRVLSPGPGSSVRRPRTPRGRNPLSPPTRARHQMPRPLRMLHIRRRTDRWKSLSNRQRVPLRIRIPGPGSSMRRRLRPRTPRGRDRLRPPTRAREQMLRPPRMLHIRHETYRSRRLSSRPRIRLRILNPSPRSSTNRKRASRRSTRKSRSTRTKPGRRPGPPWGSGRVRGDNTFPAFVLDLTRMTARVLGAGRV
jgi:hypothetical protein